MARNAYAPRRPQIRDTLHASRILRKSDNPQRTSRPLIVADASLFRVNITQLQATVAPLDLASLASVRQVADSLAAAHEGSDVLAHDPGVMAIPR